MRSSTEYIDSLKKNAILSPFGWQLTTVEAYDDTYGNRKFKKTLEILNAEDILARSNSEELKNYVSGVKKGSFNELINVLAQSLKEDIADCVTPNDKAVLTNTHLTLIPMSKVAAFCFNQDEFFNKLDGNVICINQGLYFCLSMISKAIVIENIRGSLIDYKRSGAHEYNCAIKMFLKPNKEDLNEIFFDNLPAEVYGEISAHQSKVAMLILQFIALHEYGHIINGDLDQEDLYGAHLNAIMANGTIVDGRISEHWDLEYAADAYALRALSSRSKNSLTRWANFTAIYLFFKWLADIETISGEILCPYHPPPMKRVERLKKLMILREGVSDAGLAMCNNIQEQSSAWLADTHKYIK